MSDYTQQTENALSSLSRTMGAHIKQLDNILKKGANVHPVKPRKLKALKAPASFMGSLESSFTGGSFSSANTFRTSSSQALADMASAISKAISRDL